VANSGKGLAYIGVDSRLPARPRVNVVALRVCLHPQVPEGEHLAKSLIPEVPADAALLVVNVVPCRCHDVTVVCVKTVPITHTQRGEGLRNDP